MHGLARQHAAAMSLVRIDHLSLPFEVREGLTRRVWRYHLVDRVRALAGETVRCAHLCIEYVFAMAMHEFVDAR